MLSSNNCLILVRTALLTANGIGRLCPISCSSGVTLNSYWNVLHLPGLDVKEFLYVRRTLNNLVFCSGDTASFFNFIAELRVLCSPGVYCISTWIGADGSVLHETPTLLYTI